MPHPTMSEVACGVHAVFVFKENRDQLLGAFADTITNEPGATFEELMRRSFEEALAELAARGIMIKAAGIKE